MRVEISRETIEEICCCIVDCGMNRDEACDYALKVVFEEACEIEDAEVNK
ncbi:hypothetical protein [Vibrio galatheae]|nr:hypothetical protein [Vibrio galatheae]